MTFKRGGWPEVPKRAREKGRNKLKPAAGTFPSQESSDDAARLRDFRTAAINICSLSQWNESRLAFPPGDDTRTKKKIVSSNSKLH